MTEKEYYKTMGKFDPRMDFETIHKNWFECFSYILKSFKVGFNSKAIKSMFYHFDMANWKALHKENTEYKDCDKQKLIKKFCGECWYISDRASYDRLFRTHWLFIRAFEQEIMVYKYPSLYKTNKK